MTIALAHFRHAVQQQLTPAAEKRSNEPTMKLSGTDLINFAKANRNIRQIGKSNLLVCAKYKDDLVAADFVVGDGTVSASFSSCTGWIRIGKELPGIKEFQGRRLKISVTSRPSADPTKITAISVMHLSPEGSLVIIKKIAANVTISKKNYAHTFMLQQGLAKELVESGIDSDLYIFLEITKPCALSDLNLSWTAVAPPPHDVPYTTSSHPLSTWLVENNSRVSVAARTDQNAFLLDQSELSVRLDCFETAYALLSVVNPRSLGSDELVKKWLWTTTEILIARGETDALKDVLLNNSKYTMRDDSLFTALSICFPADTEHARHFVKLPSGKLNRNYISRLSAGHYGLGALRHTEEQISNFSEVLLVASDIRKHSPSSYERLWNVYLESFNMQPLRFMRPRNSSNVLSDLYFAGIAPVTEGPRVSIIMSAYNAETTINYAVDSILGQSYQNIELLICDDQSDDATVERLLRYKDDHRVKLFRSNGNQGPYNIRSGLIKESSGDFITFQDADDFAHPERLHLQIKSMSKGKRFSMGRWVRIRPDGEVVFFRDQLCLRMCVVSLMVPREVFSGDAAYRPVLCGGDSELYENIKATYGADSIADINAPVIFGLWSDSSLTRSGGIEATEDGFRSIARRAYAEATSRQRLLGKKIVPDAFVDKVNESNGIFRENRGISPI